MERAVIPEHNWMEALHFDWEPLSSFIAFLAIRPDRQLLINWCWDKPVASLNETGQVLIYFLVPYPVKTG